MRLASLFSLFLTISLFAAPLPFPKPPPAPLTHADLIGTWYFEWNKTVSCSGPATNATTVREEESPPPVLKLEDKNDERLIFRIRADAWQGFLGLCNWNDPMRWLGREQPCESATTELASRPQPVIMLSQDVDHEGT